MITYQVLPESILIIFEGQPFSINFGDERYDKVMNNLDDLKPEHFTLYSELPNGFKLVDGALYFHKFAIPAKVESMMFKSQYRQSFINFWANVTSRHDFETVCKIVKLMEVDNLRPISEDGMIVYISPDSKNYLSKDFVTCGHDIQSIEKRLSKSYPTEFFKKREFFNEIKSLLKEKASLSYISYFGKMTKGASLDETVELLKSRILFDHPEIFCKFTKELVLNFIKNKTNSFQKDRFLSLVTNREFITLVSYHNFCREERIEFILDDISFDKANELVKREYYRLNREGCGLGIISNFSYTEKLNQLSLGDEYKLVIPQTDKELISWGSIIGNCVGNGSYAKKCKSKNGYILGLTQQNQIIASIEISTNKGLDQIVQFEGKFSGSSKSHLNEGSPLWQKVQFEILKKKQESENEE